MTDIAVIILQKNERLHIKRCLEKLAPLEPRQIFVVDCYSTDGSDKIAAEMGATVVYHEWPGNQAAQFNWALDNLPIESQWVLRLDADEYLYPETCEEVKKLVTAGGLPPDVTSLSFPLSRHIFGGNIRHGNPMIELVRAFKFGYGRSSNAEMDEQIVVREGRNYKLKGKFVDDSLLSLNAWKEKHRNYAKREARMAVTGRANRNKRFYYKFPPYFRDTLSREGFSMVRPAGCGIFGKGCGTGVSLIARSGGCGGREKFSCGDQEGRKMNKSDKCCAL